MPHVIVYFNWTTSGTGGPGSWVVPPGTTSLTVHGIGGGASGTDNVGIGGGGGGYAKSIISVTPGQTIYYHTGVWGSNASQSSKNTWVNKSANSPPTNTTDGIVAVGTPGNTYTGTKSGSIGTTVFYGGDGNQGGGGGAAGPFGAGANSVFPNGGQGGGGQGGAGGSTGGSQGGAGQEWTATDGTKLGSGGGGGYGGSPDVQGGSGGYYGGGGGGVRAGGGYTGGGWGQVGLIVIEYDYVEAPPGVLDITQDDDTLGVVWGDSGSYIGLSNHGLDATNSAPDGRASVRTSRAHTSGRWYVEIEALTSAPSTTYMFFGLCDDTTPPEEMNDTVTWWQDASGISNCAGTRSDGSPVQNGFSAPARDAFSVNAGDRICLAVDCDSQWAFLGLNNYWIPAYGTPTDPNGNLDNYNIWWSNYPNIYPWVSLYGFTATDVNIGVAGVRIHGDAATQIYTPPTSYLPWDGMEAVPINLDAPNNLVASFNPVAVPTLINQNSPGGIFIGDSGALYGMFFTPDRDVVFSKVGICHGLTNDPSPYVHLYDWNTQEELYSWQIVPTTEVPLRTFVYVDVDAFKLTAGNYYFIGAQCAADDAQVWYGQTTLRDFVSPGNFSSAIISSNADSSKNFAQGTQNVQYFGVDLAFEGLAVTQDDQTLNVPLTWGDCGSLISLSAPGFQPGLDATSGDTGNWSSVRANFPKTSGKWYCEVELLYTSTAMVFGVCDDTTSAAGLDTMAPAQCGGLEPYNGVGVGNGFVAHSMPALPVLNPGDRIGIFADFDAQEFWYDHNGASFATPTASWYGQIGINIYPWVAFQYAGVRIHGAATQTQWSLTDYYVPWDSAVIVSGTTTRLCSVDFTQDDQLLDAVTWGDSGTYIAISDDGRNATNDYAANIAAGYTDPGNGFRAALRTDIAHTDGQWYCEIEILTPSPSWSYMHFGVMDDTTPTGTPLNDVEAPEQSGAICYQDGAHASGSFVVHGSNIFLPNGNERVCIAVDCDTQQAWLGVDGVWIQGDPSDGSDPFITWSATGVTAFTAPTNANIYPLVSLYSNNTNVSSSSVQIQGNAQTQKNQPPPGYQPWNGKGKKNVDAPTVGTASGSSTANATGTSGLTSYAVATSSGLSAANATGAAQFKTIGIASGASTASAVGSSSAASSVAVATASGTSSAVATGTSQAKSIAAASGVSTASATTVGQILAVGSAAGLSSAIAVALARFSAVGTASGSCVVAGVGIEQHLAVAAASGTSSATGIGLARIPAVAVASGNSSATAVAASLTSGSAIANASGVATVTGVATSQVTSTATASGVSGTSFVGASQGIALGSSVGSSTAAATGIAGSVSIGTATGVSAALAASASVSLAIGHATGNAIAAMIGAAFCEAIGAASGTSTAEATNASALFRSGVGHADGTSTAVFYSGFGSVGHADGTSTARAVSSYWTSAAMIDLLISVDLRSRILIDTNGRSSVMSGHTSEVV